MDANRSIEDAASSERDAPSGANRHGRLVLALICVLALALRVGYVLDTANVPSVQQLLGDAAGYHAWARTIVEGKVIGDRPFYQAPLYPYVLAGHMAMLGDDVQRLRLAQAFWGTLAVLGLGIATWIRFGRRPALWAALLLAVYPPAMYFDGLLQKTALASCLLAWMLVSLELARTRPPARWKLLLGLTFGLLCLTRENALIWLPLLPAWLVLLPGRSSADRAGGVTTTGTDVPDATGTGWRRRLARVAWFALGAGLVLVPVAVRNAAVGGELSITTFQAGPNFYIGNGPEADGRYRPLVRGHETPTFESDDAKRLAEQALGRELSSREVSRYWLDRAWAEIREAPARWIRLCLYKLGLTLNRYEVGDVESIYVYRRFTFLLSPLAILHFGVLLPLAVLGVFATRREWRRLWVHYLMVLSMIGAVALFFVLARYRYPLVILLLPFAAVGLCWAWDRIQEGAWRHLLPPAALALVVGAVVNWPIQNEGQLDGQAFMNLGVAYAQAGDIETAQHWFADAVERQPASVEARFNLAQSYLFTGQVDQAIRQYEACVALSPDLPEVHFFLAQAFESAGRWSEAALHYRRAWELRPDDLEAKAGMERMEARTP